MKETLGTRFWDKVKPGADNACWEWAASVSPTGYGRLQVGRGRGVRLAHRVAWELSNGPVPAGYGVCHKCDNPKCCNPAHLFLGMPVDNTRDMAAKGRHWQQQKTQCPQGHPYSAQNTRRTKIGRACKACQADRQRARRARNNQISAQVQAGLPPRMSPQILGQ